MSVIPTAMPQLSPSMSFDDAGRAVLTHLRQTMPWGVWSIGRVADGMQTFIMLDDDGADLPRGISLTWEQTICIRMTAGKGPHIAPDVRAVPAYAEIAIPCGIRAYAGVPITEQDGSLFGVLCGVSGSAEDPADAANEGLLILLSGLLGIVLAADRERERTARIVADAQTTANTDDLTGLPNRRAWARTIHEEESRHAKFGDPAAVAIVDLDRLKDINDSLGHAAGDDHIRAAGTAMRRALGPQHLVARLGGDEFGILLRDTGVEGAQALVDGVHASLDEAGVAGSIGWAPYAVVTGFPGALAAADEAMYDAKRAGRQLAATG